MASVVEFDPVPATICTRPRAAATTTFAALRFVMAMAILIVPTMLMGGTLPVLARFVIRKKEEAGTGAGVLYFANTAGAVLGCFSAGFILIPGLGLRMAILVAAVLNGLVFVFAAMLSKRFGEPLEPEKPLAQPVAAPAARRKRAVGCVVSTAGNPAHSRFPQRWSP